MVSEERLPLGREVEEVCQRLLDAFNAFEKALRWFDPGAMSLLREKLRPFAGSLESAEGRLEQIDPEGKRSVVGQLREATVLAGESHRLCGASVGMAESIMQVMKARRKMCRAQEILYTLRRISPSVNRYFLEEPLWKRIAECDPERPLDRRVGLHHGGAHETPYARGACSLYVPETYDGLRAWPLVVALHGGFGHGRDYLWTWLREARSRRFLLLAPSSTGTTWSLTGDDADWEPLQRALNDTITNWSVDDRRILLTGMSDGGTYALRCLMRRENPFTAFALFSSVLPAFDFRYVAERRVMWVHGSLDWMFPVDLARRYAAMLGDAGADVTFREIENLSHTYPGEQNDAVLTWFDPACVLPSTDAERAPGADST